MGQNKNLVFTFEKMITEIHLDSFGHVNNAMYLQLLEEARWDFIHKRGFGLGVIQEKKIGPVILDLSIN